jgi:DNA polymerase elongation subunit (family B)
MASLFLLHVAYITNPESQHNNNAPKQIIQLVCKNATGGTTHIKIKNWFPWIYTDCLDKDKIHYNIKYVNSIDTQNLINFIGFTNNKHRLLSRLRVLRYPVYANNIKLYENTVKATTKFLCESGLRVGNWFTCNKLQNTSLNDLVPDPTNTNQAEMVIMGYDIETDGLDPLVNSVYQICCTFNSTSNSDEIASKSVVLCRGATDVVGDTNILVFDNEKELLRGFCKIIKETNPDFLCGYNLNGFDNGFIKTRIEKFQLVDEFKGISRIPSENAHFNMKNLDSSALGKNELMLWAIPGRIVIDLFLFCKTTFPTLPNFKLDTAAEVFLKDHKDDIPFGQIIDAFGPNGTAAKRGVIAKYCLQDGLLCNRLMGKWNTHISILEVS